MFFLNKADLDKRFKLLRGEYDKLGVSEELRGWNYDEPPVKPPSKSATFGVSELAARYCPTLRDVYLKHVLRVKFPPSLKLIRGIILHYVASESISLVKRTIYEKGLISGSQLVEELLPMTSEISKQALNKGRSVSKEITEEYYGVLEKESNSFYRFLIVQAASRVDQALSKFPHLNVDSLVNHAIPPISERKVDGSLIGLSRELSIDIYNPPLAIADLKTGEIRPFHKYAPVGYALALEADEGIEVNYGFTIYIKFLENRETPVVKLRYYLLGDETRKEFLEIRDEAMNIVMEGYDPGFPENCPDYCPYYPVCKGGKLE